MNHIVGGRLKDFLQVICSQYLLEIKIKDIFVMWETDIFSCIHHIGDKGNRLFTLRCLSYAILCSPCVISIHLYSRGCFHFAIDLSGHVWFKIEFIIKQMNYYLKKLYFIFVYFVKYYEHAIFVKIGFQEHIIKYVLVN